MSLGPLDLLKQALFSVQNDALLDEVQKRATEIALALREQELGVSEEEAQRLKRYPHWTAAVLEALSGSTEVSASDTVTRAIQRVLEDEEAQIADAFNEAMQTLPREFGRWHVRFAEVPHAPEEYQEQLRQSRVVRLAGEHARGLDRYGLSPVSFFQAARGVQLLADRLIEAALGPQADLPTKETIPALEERRRLRGRPAPVSAQLGKLHEAIRERVGAGDRPCVGIALGPPSYADRWPTIPTELALAAVRSAVYGPPEAAGPFLAWLVDVAPLRRFLFAGYEVKSLGSRAILLEQEAVRSERDLVWRWSSETEPLSVSELVPA